MGGIPGVSGPEKVVVIVTEVNKDRKSRLIPPERKVIGCTLRDLTSFCKPGGLVADLHSSTFTNAKVCLELLQHRSFVGYKIYSKCFAANAEALVETNRRQILIERSDISGTDQVADACEVLARALDGLQARKKIRPRKVYDVLCSVQLFPPRVTHLLSDPFMEHYLLENDRQISLNKCLCTRGRVIIS